ncbi:MAG: bifunctional metallophosphatase/5'-nucleotidase [Anaerofustis stercorihominis]|nr:bifunctional metallophosphatase/5'-nucleotidase [Anaerofustis stercorihominis]
MIAPVTGVFAEESTKSDDIVILYTNDVHTYIDKPISYDDIAGYKTELKDAYNDVLLVDAGDHIQGTAYGSMDKGETIIKLMNAAGYDLATLGNHEFDYGQDGRIKVTDDWASFPYVSANFYNEDADKTPVLDPYKIFDFGGKKVAIIGITTPESFTKSTPAYFQDEDGNYIYGIAGGTDGAALYAAVQEAIDAVKDEVDYVIALGHLGDDPASQPWTSEETIANTAGLDAFIDGHSHSTVEGKAVKDKEGNDVWLTQTGEYFGAIGKMIIDAETGAITTELIGYEDIYEDIVYDEKGNFKSGTPLYSDETVKAIEDAWIDTIDGLLGAKVGHTDLTFDNYDGTVRLVRKQETNTGAFAADALYYLFDNMDMDVDFAIMNGGGVRNKAITGDISYKTCKDIHTFGNVACLQTITGQQLIDALEWGARGTTEEEIGGFLHVSGVRYDIVVNVESTVQADDKGVWTGAPTGEYRVRNVEVYNKEKGKYEMIDPAAKYNLAGYNYTLRDLGDGFAMFDGAVNVLDYVMEDYMVLANYVKGFEDGEIKATNSPLNAKYEGFGVDYSAVNYVGRIEHVLAESYIVGPETVEVEAEAGNAAKVTVPVELIEYAGSEIAEIFFAAGDPEAEAPAVDWTEVDPENPVIEFEVEFDEEGKKEWIIVIEYSLGNEGEDGEPLYESLIIPFNITVTKANPPTGDNAIPAMAFAMAACAAAIVIERKRRAA